jgi:putative two-component system response regulator
MPAISISNSDADGIPQRILVADDDDSSRRLLTDLLEGEGHEVLAVSDGTVARNILRERHIDLALLDVMMPGETGFSICRELKSSKATRLTPVVLVTGLANSSDRILGIEVGADDFLNKPIKPEELLARVRSLLRMKDYVDQLEEAETVLFSLALGIEAKDPYTEGHCQRLSNYAVELGKRIGMAEDQLTALRRAGIVHDIGKLGVPEHILQKHEPLTEQERSKMMEHPAIGERICAPLRSFRLVLPIIRHHHERMDGSGYPDGLKGEAIPITARIMTTVDVYDALTTDRPYRKALPLDHAFWIMREEVKKGWWDGQLVEQFHSLVTKKTGPAAAGTMFDDDVTAASSRALADTVHPSDESNVLTLGQTERDYAIRVLEELGGNKVHAARQLGISRGRLYRILRRIPESEGSDETDTWADQVGTRR